MEGRHEIALDFETYYSDEYSLRRMSIPEYILDPRWEMILCAVKVDGGAVQIIDGPTFPAFLAQFDPRKTTTICFNALFDNSILSWRYGFVPGRMYDSMGMARAQCGHVLHRSNLRAVASYLGCGQKGDAINKVKGMRAWDIKAAGLWDEFCQYATDDTQLNYNIFMTLLPHFPFAERRIADMVLRAAVEPRFQIDVSMLEKHLEEVRREKAELLSQSGVTVSDLMSNAKFQTALEALGVRVETKFSKVTGKEAPAFAKTDKFMAKLVEDEDPRVQALAAARLGHKSTIEETRAQTLLNIAGCDWSVYRDGKNLMPVPLGYGKTHTHRLAGEWKMNMQNLPSGRTKGSMLRRSLIAPPGHTVVTCDLAQIEARLNAWFSAATDLMTQFAQGKDPYAEMATEIFGYKVDRDVQKVEGFIGKTAILGLGYGCGVDRFFSMVETQARVSGIDLSALGWDLQMARRAVGAYRTKHWQIKQKWTQLDNVIRESWGGPYGQRTMDPITIGHGFVQLPGGLLLRYHDPRYDANTSEWIYSYGRGTYSLYGAKLLENIIQGLARVVVMNAALRIRGHANDKDWSRFVLQAHDELVYIVPDEILEHAKQVIHSEMVRVPTWAPGLPMKAATGVGQSYGEAK